MANSGDSEQYKQPSSFAKRATGVTGFDAVLAGGIPEQRVTLIKGGSGAGKTVLALEVAYRAAAAGDRAVFISFEESAASLRSNAQELQWDLSRAEESGALRLLDPHIDHGAVPAGAFTLHGLMAILDGVVQEVEASVVVLDALDAVLSVFRDTEQQQIELARILRWLAEHNVTAILTSKLWSGSGDTQYEYLDFLADCVIALDQRVVGNIATRRLRIVKLRGSGYASNEHPFLISKGGVTIMPVSDAKLLYPGHGEPVTSGISELDSLLGGGFHRASVALLLGPTGIGKTTLLATFAESSASRGETVVYVSLKDSQAALITSMTSPGIDLAQGIDEGTIHIETAMPEAMGAEEHLHRILSAIDRLSAHHVILDAISACSRMGPDPAAFNFLIRLIVACRNRGLTLLMADQARAADTDVALSSVPVASLIDTIVYLAYDWTTTPVGRNLLVIKSRGTSHSLSRHGFEITDSGLRILSAARNHP